MECVILHCSTRCWVFSWLSLQGFWQSKLDGSVLLRDSLLQVLAQLDFILITALDSVTVSSAVTAAHYSSATAAGSRALPIEQCSCPPGYAGLSCERCSPGYYRRNGTCVPCNCNSRSAFCDEFTGVCLVSAHMCTCNTVRSVWRVYWASTRLYFTELVAVVDLLLYTLPACVACNAWQTNLPLYNLPQ